MFPFRSRFRSRTVTTEASQLAESLARIERRLSLIEAQQQVGPATYVGNNRIVTKVVVNGMTFAFLLEADDRLITPWLVAAGAFETSVTNFFLSQLRPDSHCLDVGANFGYFACLMARLAPAGKVLAIEADRHVFELVRDNLAINGGLLNAEALHMAASDRIGELTLHRRRTRSGNTSIVDMGRAFTNQMGEEASVAFTVPAAPIDSLLDRFGGRVDLIKVDVEGAEPLALAGAARTIESNPAIQIIMEWSPGQIQAAGFDLRSFVSDIQAMGLRIFDVESGSQTPLSADELLGLPYRAGVLFRRN